MPNLQKFKEYLDSEEFLFISDKRMIQKLKLMVTDFANDPKYQNKVKIFIEKYIRCFNKVVEEVGNNIVKLRHAKNGINEITQLDKGEKALIQEIDLALEYLTKGLNIAFKPENISQTKIKREIIIRYITNKKSQIHDGFQYNKCGSFSFYKKLSNLTRSDLFEVINILQNQKSKKINNWSVWNKSNISIVGIKHTVFSSKLYALFTAREENLKAKLLQSNPKSVEFSEAA